MVGLLLRVAGGLVAAVATVVAWLASVFRLESSSELGMIERLDWEIGGAFAVAFLLLLAPSRLKAPLAWPATVTGALVVWLCVSGSLIWSHREQHRIRSTLPTAGNDGKISQGSGGGHDVLQDDPIVTEYFITASAVAGRHRSVERVTNGGRPEAVDRISTSPAPHRRTQCCRDRQGRQSA